MAGIGDFNGDGTSDILWRNTVTGDNVVFLMNQNSVASTVDLGGVGTAWSVAGIGDYTGDGTSDILWRNGSTGGTVEFIMSGGSIASTVNLGSVSTTWSIEKSALGTPS